MRSSQLRDNRSDDEEQRKTEEQFCEFLAEVIPEDFPKSFL